MLQDVSHLKGFVILIICSWLISGSRKKLSNFSQNQDWTRDCNNYVAKQYMDHVERETYFDDVKLQMDAKLWSEEYNRHCPPKPVDIFQMAVLEFPEREGQPLFHVEHFIEGEYIKYNSNSGFVDNAICRNTPHAFSHFTFERSGHEVIVVDIQGVGDLYTDPQIHTAAGEHIKILKLESMSHFQCLIPRYGLR